MTLARKAREAVGTGSAAVSPRKKYLALGVAAIADVVQVVFWPMMGEGAMSPFEDALDIAVAVILMVVLGFQWRLAFAFAMELVPGMDLFPTWTAVVLSIPTHAALPGEAPVPAALPPGAPPRFLKSSSAAVRLMEPPCTASLACLWPRFLSPRSSSPRAPRPPTSPTSASV